MQPGSPGHADRAGLRMWVVGLGLVVLFAVYLVSPNPVQSGDNHAHCLTALSLVRGEWGFIDRLRPYWASADLGVRSTVIEVGDGRAVGGTGIGAPLLLAPFYAVARALGAEPLLLLSGPFNQLIAALFSAVAVAAFWVAARRIAGPTATWLATITFGLGSSVLSVLSREPWQHTFVVALQALTMLAVLRGAQPAGRGRLGLAGALVGLAGLVRATSFVYALPWWWWLRRGNRTSTWPFWAGLAPGLMATFAYNWLVFGSPFLSGQVIIGRVRFASDASRAVSWDPLAALAGLLASPGRGLFVYSPVFLWALATLVATWAATRRSAGDQCRAAGGGVADVAVLLPPALLAVAINVLSAATWKEWAGGYTYGPRYLADTLPFWGLLVLAAAVRMRELGASWRRVVLVLAWPLLGVSVAVHAAGLLVSPYRADAYSARIDPDHHPERLWRWQDFPPLDNLRLWRADRETSKRNLRSPTTGH